MLEARLLDKKTLLQAARELLVECGYGAMSMRQLAARVGLQHGSLYHHVASKQDLLLDVLMDILRLRLEDWRDGSHSRDLHGYVSFLLNRQRSHPCEELLLRHESRHLNCKQQLWLEQMLDDLRMPLRKILVEGKDEGRYNIQDVDHTTDAIIALLDSANSMRRKSALIDEQRISRWIMRMSLVALSE